MLQWNEWLLLANCMKKHCKKETKAYLTFLHSLHLRYKDKPINIQTVHRQENTHTGQLQCVLNECQTHLKSLIHKLKETLPVYIQHLQSQKDSRILKNLIQLQTKINAMKETRLTINDVKKLLHFQWDIISG